MKAARGVGRFFSTLRWFPHSAVATGGTEPVKPRTVPRIGLALGGGFARGVAHAGVLRVFERHRIPIHAITGVSAGAIAAAAFASGASADEIARAGCAMRFTDVARWSLRRTGFVVSERMQRFLEKLLKCYRFEDMQIPLGVVATDLSNGETLHFRDSGDVFTPIRASCAYPGLFQPVRHQGRMLVDGAMSVEIPALLARQLGATHVIAVHLPAMAPDVVPRNVFQIVNRCFQILQSRNEDSWRCHSDLVISPDVRGIQWDAFTSGPEMLKAGEAAALAALPKIQEWLEVGAGVAAVPARGAVGDLATPGLTPA
jgi:NTE family protein